MKRPPALLFGVPIADLTMAETIELIGEFVEEGRSSGRTHQITTANVDFLVNALEDTELRGILQRADACLADGMPVVWGTSLLGMPVRERVAGADLVPLLIEASAATRWRIHVFGSSASVADRATALFADRYPGAAVTIDPGPVIADPAVVDESVLDAITAVDADILCVALGNPKQERFIEAHRDALGVPVMIGIGGSIDLLVGERRRAPVWTQRIGAEWIARLVQEPGRLGRRYAHDLRVFGPRLAQERRAARRRARQPGIEVAYEGVGAATDAVEVRIGGSEVPGPVAWLGATNRIAEGAALHLRSGSATAIGDRGLAVLIGLVQQGRRRGAEIRWLDDPSALATALHDRGIPTQLAGLP